MIWVFFHDFSRPGNDHFKIPWLFQVFHDRTNPADVCLDFEAGPNWARFDPRGATCRRRASWASAGRTASVTTLFVNADEKRERSRFHDAPPTGDGHLGWKMRNLLHPSPPPPSPPCRLVPSWWNEVARETFKGTDRAPIGHTAFWVIGRGEPDWLSGRKNNKRSRSLRASWTRAGSGRLGDLPHVVHLGVLVSHFTFNVRGSVFWHFSMFKQHVLFLSAYTVSAWYISVWRRSRPHPLHVDMSNVLQLDVKSSAWSGYWLIYAFVLPWYF